MEKKEQAPSPLTSILPMVLMGGLVLFAMNFMGNDKEKGKKTFIPAKQRQVSGYSPDNDFKFKTANPGTKPEIIRVDTGPFLVELSSIGGRVSHFYMKSHGELHLPEAIIQNSKDPIAKKYHALEVTRNHGMDFQPHIYFKDQGSQRLFQVSNPPLNNAVFKAGKLEKDPVTGIQQIEYRTPVRFKGHRLELVKVYRFLKDENFFRQITILRNLEGKEFQLANNGDLYYKHYSDIGPQPDPTNRMEKDGVSRFWFNGEDLERRANIEGGTGGGCGGGCGNDIGDGYYDRILATQGGLDFIGSASRYFFSYTRFMRAPGDSRNTPDGVMVANVLDPTGQENATTIFKEFILGPVNRTPLDFGSVDGNARPGGNRDKVKRLQARKDLMAIDNMVFMGVRTDEFHAFHDQSLMFKEFGIQEPDDNARQALFSNSYWGFFSKIKDMIVWLMRRIYSFVGNYGWAIVIIATGFKILTWPLQQMQVKSMKRLQEHKPELDKMNETYKDDPQAKQKAMMDFYKKHKINPAKGCLPMLIQMPIFIALYSAFQESIELWNSPFILWMTDLSSPDTIFTWTIPFVGYEFALRILPLVMTGSQLAQQMFTTVTTDNNQKMMMYLMPVIMLFMFYSMPSGVTLYWTLQNVIGVISHLVASKFTDSDDPAPA